jgi:hypothetical protein
MAPQKAENTNATDNTNSLNNDLYREFPYDNHGTTRYRQ